MEQQRLQQDEEKWKAVADAAQKVSGVSRISTCSDSQRSINLIVVIPTYRMPTIVATRPLAHSFASLLQLYYLDHIYFLASISLNSWLCRFRTGMLFRLAVTFNKSANYLAIMKDLFDSSEQLFKKRKEAACLLRKFYSLKQVKTKYRTPNLVKEKRKGHCNGKWHQETLANTRGANLYIGAVDIV
jgi:hypothetical protein